MGGSDSKNKTKNDDKKLPNDTMNENDGKPMKVEDDIIIYKPDLSDGIPVTRNNCEVVD